jgi:Calcineurin-like phosphoesterase
VKTIVVGDIHGCFDELTELLDGAALGADDRVVAVGDLCVKGPKNREVLDLFIDDRRLSSVLGNHDRAVLRALRGEPIELKKSQQVCFEELRPDADRYLRFLDSLPLWIDLGRHLVVHAGLRPGVAVESQSEDDLVELRTLGGDRASREGVPWYEVYEGDREVLFGHWPAAAPRRGPRAVGLDTGCVYGYELTALVVETGEFLSVRARRAYDAPKYKPA